MNQRYALGIDYGTNSCRSLLVDLDSGSELGSAVFPYPSGERGILTDARDPHVARQRPQDYLDGLEYCIKGALAQASQAQLLADSRRKEAAFAATWAEVEAGLAYSQGITGEVASTLAHSQRVHERKQQQLFNSWQEQVFETIQVQPHQLPQM